MTNNDATIFAMIGIVADCRDGRKASGGGEVTVLRSFDTTFGLDAQAVRAAKQWVFNSDMKEALAVAVRVTIEMTFTLV